MEQLQTAKHPGAGIKQLTLAALMVALSAVGAFIKFPGPLGSIAMDSCPGYLYASICGPLGGVSVAFLGHLASAFTVGFPLGVPIHLVVAAEMGLCAAVYGWIGRRLEAGGGIGTTDGRARTLAGRSSRPWLLAGLVAVVLNGAGAPLALSPWLGMAAVVPLILPLTVASLMNVALAILMRRVLNSKRVSEGIR
ncbi:MAG TPA: ECF transporter S component [Firmicutes bacterium]|nr:ECF transporter S component [Candidatus Fermentithermobacillaceae bacterium]